MFGADIFQRLCTNLHLREKVMNQFLHFVAAITFFCMSAKHNVSGQSTFYTALKTLEKSTHFMLTYHKDRPTGFKKYPFIFMR